MVLSEFLDTLDVNNMEDHYIMEDEDDKQKKREKKQEPTKTAKIKPSLTEIKKLVKTEDVVKVEDDIKVEMEVGQKRSSEQMIE